jgi:hypothetical protein
LFLKCFGLFSLDQPNRPPRDLMSIGHRISDERFEKPSGFEGVALGGAIARL